MRITVLGIALFISAALASDQISIAGDWNCRKGSTKYDAFTLEAEEIFEFSSEGWYISNAGVQASFSNGGSFSTSLNIMGLWSVDGRFLVREMAQVLVSNWDPSTSPVQDDEVATLLKSEYETGRSIKNEVRWSDGNRMELLGESGVIDFACERRERQAREVSNVASAA